MSRTVTLLPLVLLVGGCLLSEQVGSRPEDMVLSYDTHWNRFILVARSGAVLALAVWIVSAWKKSVLALFLGAGLVIAAGWLVERDYTAIGGYRIELTGDALVLDIPPEPPREILWRSIQELSVEGETFEARNIGPFFEETMESWESTGEWQNLDLKLQGGDRVRVNLSDLSASEREMLREAIVKRAGLVLAD